MPKQDPWAKIRLNAVFPPPSGPTYTPLYNSEGMARYKQTAQSSSRLVQQMDKVMERLKGEQDGR